jgi:hypothetical protein
VEVDKPSRKKIVNKEKEEHHGLQFWEYKHLGDLLNKNQGKKNWKRTIKKAGWKPGV